MKILFRVDASYSIGTGHVVRCVTLASQFRKHQVDVVFCMKRLKGNLIRWVEQQGFRVVENLESADVAIIDHYGIDVNVERSLRSFFEKIIVIDDLANRVHDCDVLLDQNITANYSTRYEKLVPVNCKKMLGPAYLMMRKEFIDERRRLLKRSGEIKNLLVFMGGTDPTNETQKVLDALKVYSPFEEVHVVVGENNPMKNKIQTDVVNYGFKYHEQINYMANLMNHVDFSIGAGGSTTWERCFLGLPSTSTIVAENQLDSTLEAERLGVIINLGCHQYVTSENYLEVIQQIKKTPVQNKNMGERGLAITEKVSYPHPLISYLLEEYI